MNTTDKLTVIELSKEEIDKYIDELYSCFPTGREFEIFLNSFLVALGFEEVVTTQYVGDKGIDLTCIKSGLDLNGTDTLNYYVQAKLYARNNKVQAKEVRDLKGTTKRDKNGKILSNNYVNVFITTSSFTNGALSEAVDNPNMPVITIDGARLIQYCIEKGIGFNYKPVFSKSEIIALTKTGESFAVTSNNDNVYLVEREITKNDIRARILVIPQIVKNELAENQEKFTVIFNGVVKLINIDKSRRYFGGVTEFYKQFGLLTEDGAFICKKAKWKIDGDKIIVDLV